MSAIQIPQPRTPVPFVPQPRKPVRADVSELRAYIAEVARAEHAAAARWYAPLTRDEQAALRDALISGAGTFLDRGAGSLSVLAAAAECLDLTADLGDAWEVS
jgi:hypothetical protein